MLSVLVTHRAGSADMLGYRFGVEAGRQLADRRVLCACGLVRL